MHPSSTKPHLFCVAILGGGLLATPAMAAFTPIKPAASFNKSHQGIFADYYGGDFTATGPGGLSFTNGSVTATRVDDADDQTFNLGTFSVTEIASFAALPQTLGFKPGGIGTGGGLTNLLSVPGGENDNPANFTVGPVDTDGTIRFVRSSTGLTSSSAESENVDGVDRLVTYSLTGDGIDDTLFALFFEDRKAGTSDEDFNDLVVLVGADGFAAVPTPSAAMAGLGLLGLIGLRRRRGDSTRG